MFLLDCLKNLLKRLAKKTCYYCLSCTAAIALIAIGIIGILIYCQVFAYITGEDLDSATKEENLSISSSFYQLISTAFLGGFISFLKSIHKDCKQKIWKYLYEIK